MKVACFGSKDLTLTEIKVCELIGKKLAEQDHTIVSGNSAGAEQAFARGFNTVKPSGVTLILPWRKYEEQFINNENNIICYSPKIHSSWDKLYLTINPEFDKLSETLKKVLTRNVGIVNNSDFVLVWVSSFEMQNKKYEDPQVTVMKIANALKKSVLNLADQKSRTAFLEKIGLTRKD